MWNSSKTLKQKKNLEAQPHKRRKVTESTKFKSETPRTKARSFLSPITILTNPIHTLKCMNLSLVTIRLALILAVLTLLILLFPLKTQAKDLIIKNQLESENAYIQDNTQNTQQPVFRKPTIDSHNDFTDKTLSNPQVKGKAVLSTIAIGVSPAIAELPVDPVKTKVAKVYVFNNTNVPLPIHAFSDNFSVNEIVIDSTKDNSNTFDASNWITIDPPDFILQPNEEKEVYISISPTPNAEPGGHYATVYFRPLISEEYITPDKTYLTAQIGVLLFLTVSGKIKESANISNLTLPKYPTPDNFLPTVYIQNNGNIHIIPKGKITIKGLFRKTTHEFPIENSIVLPNTEKKVVSHTKASLKTGLYRTYFTGNYGSNNKPLASSDKIFFVFPNHKTLITIFILIIVTLLVQKFHRNIPLAIKVLFGKIDEYKSGRN